jgi:putative DNA primase/helicase
VAPEEAGAAAYQLASGQAKARAQTNGTLRRRLEWRVVILSTGEIPLASHIEASRKGDRPMTGQELRLLDIEADAGKGMGVWQALHGLQGPAAFSDAIKAAAGGHYGHAGPAFVDKFARTRDETKAMARELVAGFLESAREAGDTGQAERGAMRFAVVAAAGELAAIWGIVPWTQGMASAAALVLFKRWAAGFGRARPREDQEIFRRMRHLLETDRTAFEVLDDKPDDGDAGSPGDDLLAPWRSRDGEARQLRIKGYIFAWRPSPQEPKEMIAGFHDAGWAETFKGLDTRQAARVLADHGFLVRGDGDRPKRAKKVRGQNRRLHWVRVALLEADLGE